MIILNTTYYIHSSVDAEFRRWVRDEYFPSALSQCGLQSPVFATLLIEPQEGMAGYAVQLSATSREVATNWHDGPAAALRSQLSSRFGQKVLFFTTYMETIDIDL